MNTRIIFLACLISFPSFAMGALYGLFPDYPPVPVIRSNTPSPRCGNLPSTPELPALSFAMVTPAPEKPVTRTEMKFASVFMDTQHGDYQINFKGTFIVSPDDKDIIGGSKGSYLEITRVAFGNDRTLRIEAQANGRVNKEYLEGGNEKPFAPSGAQWLADILPELIQRKGIGATSRVIRIYDAEGIRGVLEEIYTINRTSRAVRNLYFLVAVDQLELDKNQLQDFIPEMAMIESNSLKGSLLRELLFKYDLSGELLELLLQVTSTLEYNTERGSVLRVVNNNFPRDTRILEAYLDVIRAMEINSEKGNVIKDLLQTRKLSTEEFIRILETVSEFSSEREKGALLLMMIDYLPEDKRVINELSRVVDEISSPYFVLKGEILNSLADLGQKNQPSENINILIQLMRGAEDFESNSQKGLMLRKVNRAFVNDDEFIRSYFSLLEEIDDNLEGYNVILDLIRRNEINEKVADYILEYTEELLDDDFQHAAGAVLRELLSKMEFTDMLIYKFFDLINDMDQNGTIEEILRLAIQNNDLMGHDKTIPLIIEAMDQISVDIEKSTLLMRLKPFVKKSDEGKFMYRDAAEDLQSNYLQYKTLQGMGNQ